MSQQPLIRLSHQEYMDVIIKEFWPKAYFPLTPETLRLAALNWVASLSGEMVELDQAQDKNQYLNEAGDCYFYLSSLAESLGIKYGANHKIKYGRDPFNDPPFDIAASLCGQVAGWAVRGRSLDRREAKKGICTISSWVQLLPYNGEPFIPLSKVRIGNIQKLRGGGAGWQKEKGTTNG